MMLWDFMIASAVNVPEHHMDRAIVTRIFVSYCLIKTEMIQ